MDIEENRVSTASDNAEIVATPNKRDDNGKQAAQSLLKRVAAALRQRDPELKLSFADDGLEFWLCLRPDAVSPPTFNVSAELSHGGIVIKLKDGQWQQNPHTLGAWGQWTDEKPVYHGELDERTIFEILTRAFTEWEHYVTASNERKPPSEQ